MTNSDLQIVPRYTEVSFSPDPNQKSMTIYFAWGIQTSTGPKELDRPITYGIDCLPRYLPRLTLAFLEGKLFDNPELARDINGKTYIKGDCLVDTKRLSSSLTKLGY